MSNQDQYTTPAIAMDELKQDVPAFVFSANATGSGKSTLAKMMLSPLPAHLRDDASYLQCTLCGRKSWGGDAVNSACGMPQPSGVKCDGILQGIN